MPEQHQSYTQDFRGRYDPAEAGHKKRLESDRPDDGGKREECLKVGMGNNNGHE
ncbi:hypothetical protein LTR49_028445, partial [Elasticomyces elasticus]